MKKKIFIEFMSRKRVSSFPVKNKKEEDNSWEKYYSSVERVWFCLFEYAYPVSVAQMNDELLLCAT